MATTIKLKNGSGAPLAGDLVQGEPALDLTNKRLYTEDSGGTVIEVGTNPTSLTTGTFTSTGIDDNATSTAITIDSSQRIGVGTASPAYKLDIYGDSSSNVDVLHLLNENVTSGNSVGVMFENYSGGGLNQGRIKYLNSGSNNSNSFVFEQEINGVNGLQETMRISNAGNVGIGTASPDGKLNVFSASAGSVSADADADELVLENSGNVGLSLLTASTGESGIYFGNPGTNGQKDFYLKYYHELHATTANRRAFTFNTGSAERMRIDASGNVGIGNTSPATFNAAQCNNLVVGTGSGSEGITVYSGTTSQGGLAFADGTSASDQYRGLIQYDHNSNGMLFWTNASERMRIDSSGNVGIGITPSYTLDIQAIASSFNPVRFSGHGSSIDAFLYTDTAYWSIGDTAAYGGNLWGGNKTSNFVHAQTNGLERMRIDSSGRVGIGTSSPSATLHSLVGSAGAGTLAQAMFGYAGGSTHYLDANTIIFRNGSATETMRIDSSGNVGINNTSPSSYYATDLVVGAAGEGGITIASTATTVASYLMFADGTTGDARYRGYIGYGHNTDLLGLRSASDIQFLSGGSTERMRIDASGNLLVGKTSLNDTTVGFQVEPSGRTTSTMASSTSGTSSFNLYSTGAGAYRFYVSLDGQVRATNTSILAISDASLKENVRDLDKGLDTINALQPRRFDWKNGDGNDIMGFIAQEVEEVMPELVHDYKYTDEENKKGLKMGDMVPSMVKAIQELSAQVNELKAEVAALKGA
jgi:hypothetical protein